MDGTDGGTTDPAAEVNTEEAGGRGGGAYGPSGAGSGGGGAPGAAVGSCSDIEEVVDGHNDGGGAVGDPSAKGGT